MRSLVSATLAAVRARDRQYEIRDLLERLREADRQKDEFLATLAKPAEPGDIERLLASLGST